MASLRCGLSTFRQGLVPSHGSPIAFQKEFTDALCDWSTCSAELSARDALGNSINRGWRIGRHVHMHLHSKMVRWESDKGTVEWRRMTRIAHDGDRDKTDRAGASTCGIEIDPTGAWQIDLRPGMGRSTRWAARRLLRIAEWNSEISRHKPCGETKRTCRLDHQHGEIAAAAMAEPERLLRQLDSLRLPSPVEETLIDALRKPSEKFENSDRPIRG